MNGKWKLIFVSEKKLAWEFLYYLALWRDKLTFRIMEVVCGNNEFRLKCFELLLIVTQFGLIDF